MLAVVQDQEQVPAADDPGQLGGTVIRSPQPGLHRVGDGGRHLGGITEGGQLRQPHAVGVLAGPAGGGVQRQPRLAAAARSGQRDQAGAFGQRGQFGQLGVAWYEAGQLDRQVVPAGVQGARWRAGGGQVGMAQLPDVFGRA